MRDKYRLVTGYGAWRIGNIRVSDGPHGVRAQEDGAKNNDSYEATCFPTACAAACSWNRETVSRMAGGIAREAKELGVSVVLGPGVNIKRSPLCGRNFEYYSEDPFLAGSMASSYIRAMQNEGVGTSLKHFAGNSQETHRMTANSMIDERALHEIYLSAFEMAVKEASPATIMASYNYLNGIPACENRLLLTDILRVKWGYRGLVMSDWGACVDLPACIGAGMDVEMPDSNGNHIGALKEAVKEGRLPEQALDEAVSRVRKLCREYPRKELQNEGLREVTQKTRKEDHRLAQELEGDCAVLLKNDSFLPLRKGSKILIIGDLAFRPRYQGGGSSHIHTETVDQTESCFTAHGARVKLVRGYRSDTFERDRELESRAILLAKKAAEKHIPILFFGGLTDMAEGEGYDRDTFALPHNQEILLKQILRFTDRIGFISFSGAPYDMKVPSECRALLQMYLGGEGVMEAVSGIVMGDVNPSGKLAETIPYTEKDVPSYGLFGNQEGQRQHPDDVEYRESIFVGYRYYDTYDIPVRYCFGHGLSYTKFSYSDLKIEKDGNGICHVRFRIANTGERAGSETAEIYVKNPDTEDFRPRRELKGFTKVSLKPGEEKEVEVLLDDRAFSAYQDGEFRVIKGLYEIQAGASLQDIRLIGRIDIDGVSLKSPLTLQNGIPLSSGDFGKLYEYERTDFSHRKPGDFSMKNSLIQLKDHSVLARIWIGIGKTVARLMYFPKPTSDPEVRMTTEVLLEGNLDCILNQSGGKLSRETIQKIVDSANKERRKQR